ncbi:MAG: hypothetical protein QOG15_2108 [Solirubrobacteraceae bacterium]|nr:hypothetical protein [Solirubrobacteraceae bacterium]
MELIVALHELARPGGPQTYALTVAEQLARLGHGVTLYARELGPMAGLARERGLAVTARSDELPERADGVLVGVDRSLAFALAERYPDAARVYVVHTVDDIHLPPPVDGVVAATVVLNDRFAARAAASVGAGEVVRLRQPVDMRRFSVRSPPAERPERVLLLGDYHGDLGSRAEILKEAWSGAGLEWVQVGAPEPQLDIAPAMYDVDVVVGHGRSIVEAMASGRPAYVLDDAGADGWVTPESYKRIESGGFSGMAGEAPLDAQRRREDLDAYRPELGRLGYDLARAHHDARPHAAALVALIEQISPEAPPLEHDALTALMRLSEAQLRAEIARGDNREEAKQWHQRAQALNEQLVLTTAEAAEATRRLEAIKATRRYRVAQAMGRVAETLRGAGRR